MTSVNLVSIRTITHSNVHHPYIMVSTRRSAQKAPSEEIADPELTLRKKPVRKTTAKAPQSAKTTTTTRMTRAAKTASNADTIPEEREVTVPTKSRARSTKPGPAGPKKTDGATAKVEPEVEPTKSARSTRTTKNATLRGKKAMAVEVEAPALLVPDEPKSRTTRQTRTARNAPQPLSPKKISQVSKPVTRNTRSGDAKAGAKVAPKRTAAAMGGSLRGRAAAKKQTVSDENSDVPSVAKTLQAEESELDWSTPVNKSTPKKLVTNREVVQPEGCGMTGLVVPEGFGVKPQSLSEDDEHTVQSTDTESHVGNNDNSEASDNESEDELCGPKTPMKRSSPSAYARYQASVQRTIQQHDEEVQDQTPARRYAVLGTQRGTPQTQNPYRQPVPPPSQIRPVTVARTRPAGRSYIFQDVRTDAQEASSRDVSSVRDDPLLDESFVPDDSIIPGTSTDASTMLSAVAPLMFDLNCVPVCSLPVQASEPGVGEDAVQDFDDEDVDYSLISEANRTDSSESDISMADHADAAEFEASVQYESFDTEDTVIITRPEDEPLAGDEDDCLSNDTPGASHTPETMHWETIQPQSPIKVDFDSHLFQSRPLPSLPEPEPTELLRIAQEIAIPHDATNGIGESAEPLVSESKLDEAAGLSGNASPRLSIQPVNMADFVREPSSPEAMSVDGTAESADDCDMASQPAQGLMVSSPVKETVTTQHEPDFVDEETMGRHDTTSQVADSPAVPHYALSTFAFDARRKSLPAFACHTPDKLSKRPNTSDGNSLPRHAAQTLHGWGVESGAGSARATPSSKPRPIDPLVTPSKAAAGDSRAKSTTPKSVRTPNERYPKLGSRANYAEHAQTTAPPSRFCDPSTKPTNRRQTFHKATTGVLRPTQAEADTPQMGSPAQKTAAVTPQRTPGERYPKRGFGNVAASAAPPARFRIPVDSQDRRQTFHKAMPGAKSNVRQSPQATVMAPSPPPKATPVDRYPRRRPRPDYGEHAKTIAAPRFKTPTKTTLKRPATAQKAASLRKAALRLSSSSGRETPVKTPLKAAHMTSSQAAMTPHPAAPLRGVWALVEVYTLEGASASAPFVALLHRLGAKTTRSWNEGVSHVIFKDGSPTTLQRVRLHNKDVTEKGDGSVIHCVNSRWVTDCDAEGARMHEMDETYTVNVAEIPRGGKRRRKSMEPSALINLGGSIVHDRKASLGRSSLSRSPLKFDSPAKPSTPETTRHAAGGPRKSPAEEMDPATDKENSVDGQGSPATPMWIAEPNKLVQQTAPSKKVRRLDLGSKDPAQSRRLTFWNGAI